MELVWIVPRYVLKTHPGGQARTQQASVVGLHTENFDEVQEKIADAERVVSIKNDYEPECSERMAQELRARRVKNLFDLSDDRFDSKNGRGSAKIWRKVLHGRPTTDR